MTKPNYRTIVFYFDDPSNPPEDLEKYLQTISGNTKLNGVKATASYIGDMNKDLDKLVQRNEELKCENDIWSDISTRSVK